MSRTTVFVVDREGALHYGRSFPHSWWSAWFIWRWLHRAYLGSDLDPGSLQADEAYRERLSQLITDPRLTPFEQLALATTCAGAVIRRSEARMVADALDAFADRYERRKTGRGLTTLPQQAAYLRELADHPDVHFICWQQTTSMGDWSGYSFRTGTDHWFIFDRYPHLRPLASSK